MCKLPKKSGKSPKPDWGVKPDKTAAALYNNRKQHRNNRKPV